MFDFIVSFVRENPELIVGLLALLISVLGYGLARVAQTKKFYEGLEKDSLYQLSENLKDIDRILLKPLGTEGNITLQDILDEGTIDEGTQLVTRQLEVLSPYFAGYCANLDKYSDNILSRKKFCFNFQEHSNKARRIYDLFKRFKRFEHKDISLSFAELHLKSADILASDG